MDAAQQVDVVVVGLGVGGEEVAGRLAQAGLSVVGVDHTLVGGECPYWGCIPTKMMIRAGNALAEAARIPGLAGSAQVTPDWAPVARRIRDEATDSWDDKVAVDRFTGKGGRFVRGRATVVAPGTIKIDTGDVYAATRALVIATGTTAVIPPIDGLAGTPYWTNRDAVEAERLPATLIVLGAGAIGLELSQVMARFGVQVTVIEGADRVLAVEEPESSDLAFAALSADGVRVRTGVRATAVSHADGFTVTLSDGSSVTGERLLVATGRQARLGDLGLETLGLDPTARFLSTDERMRAAEKVWAVGDVTGHGAFTHMAMYEADVAVRDILDQGGPAADYRAVSRVTFTDPEIGAVGRTEQQARDAGVDVQVGFTSLPSSSRGFVHGPGNDGFIKVIADRTRGVLIGATSAGPSGGEVLGALSVAIHAEVPLTTLTSTIWAYPTFHRAIGDALRALQR
jgi:pyruvate/2-oxoglutarate dehydrogenase complex dihydrolipoamide dehydrogenase (E3) component